MSLTKTCWQICGLFALAVALGCFMDFVPGHEVALGVIFVAYTAAAILFGLLAVRLRRSYLVAPPWLLPIVVVVAIVGSYCVMSAILG